MNECLVLRASYYDYGLALSIDRAHPLWKGIGTPSRLRDQSFNAMKEPELNLVHEWNVEPFYMEYPPSEYGRSLISSMKETCSSGPAVVSRSVEARLPQKVTTIDALMDQLPDLDWHSR